MMKLDEMIGETFLLASLVAFDSSHQVPYVYVIKLHGVEAGGIWIESNVLTKGVESVARERFAANIPKDKTPVYFLPYSQIAYLFAWSSKIDESILDPPET